MQASDLRAPTLLLCGIVALIIAASTLLRERVRTVHLLFALLAGDIGFWYLSQSLLGIFESRVFPQTVIALLGVLLPQFALHLFEAMVPHEPNRTPRLLRVAAVVAVPMVILVVSPLQASLLTRLSVFVYIFALLTAGLTTLFQRGKMSPSRETQRRVLFLVIVGAITLLASVIDFAWFLQLDKRFPPVGVVLSVVFLFLLAQALRYERLLDISETVARLLVATFLAFVLAPMFWVLSIVLHDRFEPTYLSMVLAIAVIFVFDPARERAEDAIQRVFFRDRFDFKASVKRLQRRLAHVLDVEEMGAAVIDVLGESRRVTGGGVYVRDQDGTGFDLLSSLGPRVPKRVEVATARALLDRLEQGPLALEEVEREARERKARGDRADAEDSVMAAASVLSGLTHGVVAGVRDDARDLIGLLIVTDDRVRDSFSSEDLALVDQLAAQIGVVIVNSRVYAQMKDRDRLAVLGQMAAGLAHEIRNPLGAIKGAAQLLADPAPGTTLDPSSREFLSIILEEVDRLDRVVGSVLDLARPSQTTVVPCDVNAVARRTLQILSAEPGSEELTVEEIFDPSLPRVSIDPEQLRQVLLNLLRNASQAMGGRGKVVVSTRVRFGRGTRSSSSVITGITGAEAEPMVELTVADNGPGISQKVYKNLFMPFFTTKDKGTGLGLAISQRIVQGAGGRIDVRSYEGKGSTFAVILPAAMDALGTPTPGPVAKAKSHDAPKPAPAIAAEDGEDQGRALPR